jgi:uncharacterized membrane protein
VATRLTTDDTARQAAVSIWWGLFGLGLVILGFLRQYPVSRRMGLALLALAVAKALLLDLAHVALEGRVASFLGLGLLMLGVAGLYNRISARAAGRAAEPHPGTPAPDAAGEGTTPVV